eukprot:9476949-Ditylum_brightwellii.AAC.1
MGVKIELAHVKGHQDSSEKLTLSQLVNKAIDVGLTWEARLNENRAQERYSQHYEKQKQKKT